MPSRTGRKLRADTPLADLIRADPRPMYQIAQAAGLRDWQLSSYANGHATPSLIHLRRICAALGCDPEDVMNDATTH